MLARGELPAAKRAALSGPGMALTQAVAVHAGVVYDVEAGTTGYPAITAGIAGLALAAS
jgi:predicted butyrate kinase (DUF1464 family)